MSAIMEEEKLAKEQEFREKMAKEKFDDFDFIVEEVARLPFNS